MEQQYAIEMRGICKSFGSVAANKNVNLNVKPGEILALLGENGSGKTTLMNMLSGIYKPDSGSILVDGREVILTDTEYRILHLLASNRKKIFSAQNIYESIWNEPYFYTSNNTVMVHIRNLRRKLGDDPQNSRTIRTVWGRGYRIE